MRTLTLFMCLLGISIFSYGQSADNLNVLDTRHTNELPSFYSQEAIFEFKYRDTIEVPGTGKYSGLFTLAPWSNNSSNGGHNYQLGFTSTGIYHRKAYPFDATWGDWMQFIITDVNGNVGIGTNTPTYKLDVIGQDVSFFSLTQENTFFIGRNEREHFQLRVLDRAGYLDYVQDSDGNNNHIFYIRNMAEGTSPDNDIRFQTSSLNRLTIKSNGNIGIGTTEPGSYKLAVEGTIGARSVKVTSASWSDYVFTPSYELMSLPETEAYIQENQHLPNIPSATEVKENGFHLEEMDAKLLAKIEELMLHTIEQEKKIDSLREENVSLKASVAEIKQQIEELKNK